MAYHGRIRGIVEERGFFFIRPDIKGPDIFGHVSALICGEDLIEAGTKVTYEMGMHNGRPCAVDVDVAD
jgi:cold shock CspA family protein